MKKKVSLMLAASLLALPLYSGSANENEPAHSAAPEAEDGPAADSTGQADSKEEVVYGTLNSDGSLNELYVVNMLQVTEPGLLIDYGDYESVKNLTDLTDIELTDDAVQIEASEEGMFYYQGNMQEAELPWDIEMSYLLDGEAVTPDELAGENGHLELSINTTANENKDLSFYENYTLQISLTADTDLISIIEAEDANIANAGKKRQITYTVMPETDADFTLTADVEDFEMEGIDINAIPLSMAIEDPDTEEMTEDMRSLSDAIEEINEGVFDLLSGVTELKDGVQSLNDGSGNYYSGIREIRDSSSELVEGSKDIQSALWQMHAEVGGSSGDMDLGELSELPDGLSQMAAGLEEAGDGLIELHGSFSEAFGSLDGAMQGIPGYDISEEDIEQLYASGANQETIDQLVETYTAAQTAKGTYDQVRDAFTAAEGALLETGNSINDMSGQLYGISSDLSASMENMDGLDGLAELEDGLGQLAGNYGEFHEGLTDYTDGVSELANSYSEIDGGIDELADGSADLESGVSELSEGTAELAEETSDLPEQFQQEIDDRLDEFDRSDFDPVSFVSADNSNVESVQFILTTEAIEIEEQETAASEEEEESPGFWEGLMNLFF
ncbi:hypothetical protein [Salipaludibacillus aurantiacus]|uniref:X-X-X-Leu-X-X-Gly heptad repeat-containing protein n=1 Tax=Salipaludibacillus aurantiacus TaxID=1601833 RepID=A0A1H9USK9_9BACI|nr:hypothetical protein [Salipaludibacillus aurantiacus]SES12319.1 X-X-X-Leu-X-X-Gly heptad repeat-containing protein [Salipaludibacillus aurantiacus]